MVPAKVGSRSLCGGENGGKDEAEYSLATLRPRGKKDGRVREVHTGSGCIGYME